MTHYSNSDPEVRGSVSVQSGAATPKMVADGPCIQRTLGRIDMPDSVLERTREQAQALMGDVLSVYSEHFGVGAVGENGTALAARSRQIDGPTGLLYGRIQSGKTVAMITFSALAIDNGFRIIVVLTSNFVELVKQTAERFTDLGRAIISASTDRDSWDRDVEHIRKHAGERGVVLVCAKDNRHLESVRDLLTEIDAGAYPALILDDEADQASLDNNTRRRSRSDNPDDVTPTKIHERINDIRKLLSHHVFVQVTATPYALLLQNVNSPVRPRFTRVLDPGDGYTGGEHFFSVAQIGGADDAGDPNPPLVFVDEQESQHIAGGPDRAPSGLEQAIAFFLVAAAAQSVADPAVLRRAQNFLCHTSHKKAEHDKLYGLIKDFTSSFEDQLEPLTGRAAVLVHWAYEELGKTLSNLPPLDEIVEDIVDRLPRRRIRVVNSEGKSADEVRGAPNFIIGGNIVGRGLTIDNLLVTYYLRKPKISQMDTMLQHARMFGYRGKLMPYTRAFLPRSLAARFNGIHEAESELRGLLQRASSIDQIPVQVVGELRPTRYGVLDTGSVVTFPSGKHLFPLAPEYRQPSKKQREIEAVLRRIFGDSFNRGAPHGPAPTDLERLLELIDLLAVAEWDNRALRAILRASATSSPPKGFVQYRTMSRHPKHVDLLTGAIGGPELAESRARPHPTLWIFRQVLDVPIWDNQLFYYPTIVFPADMPAQMYNDSELALED